MTYLDAGSGSCQQCQLWFHLMNWTLNPIKKVVSCPHNICACTESAYLAGKSPLYVAGFVIG